MVGRNKDLAYRLSQDLARGLSKTHLNECEREFPRVASVLLGLDDMLGLSWD